MSSKNISLIYLLTLALLLNSCSANFSFTGASIPPDVKSFSVEYLQNQAPLAGPTVSSSLTDALRIYITTHSKLNLTTSGDVDFQGAITGYSTAPVTSASAASGVSATTRLTITVQITYTDKNDEKKNFSSSFSRYADFPSSQNFNVVQADLITQIDNQLVQDIFDKAFNNW